MSDKIDKTELVEIFRDLQKRGIVKDRKQFAAALGVEYTGLCAAINGNPRSLTAPLMAKVKAYYRAAIGEATPEPPRDVIIPASTAQLYNNLVEVVRSQQETIARLVETLRVPGSGASQKNGLQTDRV